MTSCTNKVYRHSRELTAPHFTVRAWGPTDTSLSLGFSLIYPFSTTHPKPPPLDNETLQILKSINRIFDEIAAIFPQEKELPPQAPGSEPAINWRSIVARLAFANHDVSELMSRLYMLQKRITDS